MTRCTPDRPAARLGSGLLSLPVTHFHENPGFDEERCRGHIDWLVGFEPAGLFAVGGTGEFFSLVPSEVERVVAAAIVEAPAETPVVAPAGYGTEMAAGMARSAERVGADGLLFFLPYLTECDREGLAVHVRVVCAATEPGVVVYNRANGVLDDLTLAELAEQCPNAGPGLVSSALRARRERFVGPLPRWSGSSRTGPLNGFRPGSDVFCAVSARVTCFGNLFFVLCFGLLFPAPSCSF